MSRSGLVVCSLQLLADRASQSGDDSRSGDCVRVDDVAPRRDSLHAASILVRHGRADVGELAVLEEEEAVAARQLLQLRHDGRREVGEDVHVRLQHADVRAGLVGQAKQIGRGGDVGGETEVALL